MKYPLRYYSNRDKHTKHLVFEQQCSVCFGRITKMMADSKDRTHKRNSAPYVFELNHLRLSSYHVLLHNRIRYGATVPCCVTLLCCRIVTRLPQPSPSIPRIPHGELSRAAQREPPSVETSQLFAPTRCKSNTARLDNQTFVCQKLPRNKHNLLYSI